MFTWKRASVLWSVVKGDARLLWRALRHPLSPRWLKLGTAGLVLYLISPVDLIPDVVPVLGVLDDVVILPMAVRWMLARLPGRVRTDIGAEAPASSRPV